MGGCHIGSIHKVIHNGVLPRAILTRGHGCHLSTSIINSLFYNIDPLHIHLQNFRFTLQICMLLSTCLEVLIYISIVQSMFPEFRMIYIEKKKK